MPAKPDMKIGEDQPSLESFMAEINARIPKCHAVAVVLMASDTMYSYQFGMEDEWLLDASSLLTNFARQMMN